MFQFRQEKLEAQFKSCKRALIYKLRHQRPRPEAKIEAITKLKFDLKEIYNFPVSDFVHTAIPHSIVEQLENWHGIYKTAQKGKT